MWDIFFKEFIKDPLVGVFGISGVVKMPVVLIHIEKTWETS